MARKSAEKEGKGKEKRGLAKELHRTDVQRNSSEWRSQGTAVSRTATAKQQAARPGQSMEKRRLGDDVTRPARQRLRSAKIRYGIARSNDEPQRHRRERAATAWQREGMRRKGRVLLRRALLRNGTAWKCCGTAMHRTDKTDKQERKISQ